MNGYYSKVSDLLKKHGYRLLRSSGSAHEVWTNGNRNQVLSRNMDSRHTANAILKDCGIPHRF